jgi:hypothetical protein
MPCALLNPAQLEAALERFAVLPRPINLNFFCHSMADPDLAREQRWRQALAPFTGNSASSRRNTPRPVCVVRSTRQPLICWSCIGHALSASIESLANLRNPGHREGPVFEV